MASNRKDSYFADRYPHTTQSEQNRCHAEDYVSTCSTCMYAVYPYDYELHGFHSYCTRPGVRKENE